MTVTTLTVDGITTLATDGITVTKDIARQLDQLGADDWQSFDPLGRVRTGTAHSYPGIELIGTDTITGALVRMFHTMPIPFRSSGDLEEDGDREDALTRKYEALPLIVLPRDDRAARCCFHARGSEQCRD